jgi:hypothetical protein
MPAALTEEQPQGAADIGVAAAVPQAGDEHFLFSGTGQNRLHLYRRVV